MAKYVTKEHKEELERDVEDLRSQLTGRVADKLSDSSSKDQAEDSTYAEAIQERDILRERIEELEKLLSEIEVMEEGDGSAEYVTLGSWVMVEMNGNERELRLVGGTESDPTQSKISYESPLGEALLGAKAGETVIVGGPDGEEKEVKVLKIRQK